MNDILFNPGKKDRLFFYLYSARECFDVVEFTGNVAKHILSNTPHLDFRQRGGSGVTGHINWYYSVALINRWNGNVCVAFDSHLDSVPECIKIDGKTFPSAKEKDISDEVTRIVFSATFTDPEAASLWASGVIRQCL